MDRKKQIICLLAIVLFGLFLRLWDLGEESLWSDEAYTAIFVKHYSLEQMLTGEKQDRINPPAFYAVEKLWTNVSGDDEFNLRFPSAAFGTLLIIVVFLLAKLVINGPGAGYKNPAPFLAAFLTSISFYLVEYSQEARSYQLFALLAVYHLYLLICLLQKNKAGKSVRHWLGFIIVGVIGVYTHFGFWFFLAAEAAFLLVFYLKGWLVMVFKKEIPIKGLGFLGSYIVISLSFLHWFFVSTYPNLIQAENKPFWQPDIGLNSFFQFFEKAFFIDDVSLDQENIIGIVLLIVFLFLVSFIFCKSRRQDKRPAEEKSIGIKWSNRKLAILLLMSVISPFIFYKCLHIWMDRYVLCIIPLLYVLVAWFFSYFRKRLLILTAAIVIIIAVPWYSSYYTDAQKEPWKEAIRFIENYDDGNGVFYIDKSFSEFPWRYYYQGGSQANFPASFSKKDIEKRQQGMPEKAWVGIIYLSPKDKDRTLLQTANESFIDHIQWQKNGLEVNIFQNKKN